MKIRSLVLAVALLAFGSSGWAQELLIAPNTTGCQAFMPYAWFDLAPGAKWQATVDLSGCTTNDLGWFDYYGFIMRPSGADSLLVRDGIVLKVRDLSTGEGFACTSAGQVAETIIISVTQPTRYILTAENTGRKKQTIRVTWSKL